LINYDEIHETAKEVLNELTVRHLIISFAESCTGGLLSSFITDLNGSSQVYKTGIVAYSEEAKEEFLGVPDYVINNFGTVSIQCAKLMAEGVTEYDADIGVATSGVIGESIEGKLKGVAIIAVAFKGIQTFARELNLDPSKSRYELKLEIVHHALMMILETIEEVY
jgi:nicotinamide-nucleotide amidase